MGLLDKYNKKTLFEYDNTKERPYINLATLFENYGGEKVFVVRAIYINTKSKFGNAPVIVTDDFMVNAPTHLTHTTEEMINDSEVVQAVNDGKVGFNIYQYNGSHGKGFSIRWIEL